MPILPSISGPRDLDGLSVTQLEELAGEIREFLVENVARTGGHLGPNLGVVELTIALHRVFSSPDDPFIFDTGLAPACVGGALAALRVMREEPELAQRVRHNATELAGRLTELGFHTCTPDAAVVSVRAPSPEAAFGWSEACREQGVLVGCFRPPSVPDKVSRLRLTSRADLTEADLSRAVQVIADIAPPGAATRK